MENGEFDRILSLLTQRMDSIEDRVDQMSETLRAEIGAMGDSIRRQIETMMATEMSRCQAQSQACERRFEVVEKNVSEAQTEIRDLNTTVTEVQGVAKAAKFAAVVIAPLISVGALVLSLWSKLVTALGGKP